MRVPAAMVCFLAACSFDVGGRSAGGVDADTVTDDASRVDGTVAVDADPAAPDADPTAPDAQPAQDFHLRVEVLVDGWSYLIIHGTTVQWQHYVYAAPGRWQFVIEPTVLNGVAWYPDWPDIPDTENRDCNGCYSSTTELPISIPRAPSTTTLTEVQVRRPQAIIQEPDASNDYTLIVEITDYMVGGGDQYIVDIDVNVN